MSTISAIKTVTATSASLFAGTSALSGRVFLRARNLDECIAAVVAGRRLEPGEIIKLDFDSTAQTPETVYAASLGRQISMEVTEG